MLSLTDRPVAAAALELSVNNVSGVVRQPRLKADLVKFNEGLFLAALNI